MTVEPLVLLPGLLCDDRLFRPQVEALAGRPVTVADLTLDDDVAAMADRVLGGAPERFALAGLSMGGYAAFAILRRAPGRVTRLALLDTQAAPDTPEASARRRDLIALAGRGAFKGVAPRLLPSLIHPDRLNDHELTTTIRGMAASVGQAAFVRQQTAIMARPDSRPDLGRIACPTLILAGRDDVLTPRAAQEAMAGAIPGADLVLLGRCGHLSTLERPDAVTRQLLAWLEA